jgi:hypothetical protein
VLRYQDNHAPQHDDDVTPARAVAHRARCSRCGHAQTFHHGLLDCPCDANGCACPAWLDVSHGTPQGLPPRTARTVRPRDRQCRPATSRSFDGYPLPQGPPHSVVAHRGYAFRETESLGFQNLCSYWRFCGASAEQDSFDSLGRRRALCARHLWRSRAFGRGQSSHVEGLPR